MGEARCVQANRKRPAQERRTAARSAATQAASALCSSAARPLINQLNERCSVEHTEVHSAPSCPHTPLPRSPLRSGSNAASTACSAGPSSLNPACRGRGSRSKVDAREAAHHPVQAVHTLRVTPLTKPRHGPGHRCKAAVAPTLRRPHLLRPPTLRRHQVLHCVCADGVAAARRRAKSAPRLRELHVKAAELGQRNGARVVAVVQADHLQWGRRRWRQQQEDTGRQQRRVAAHGDNNSADWTGSCCGSSPVRRPAS